MALSLKHEKFSLVQSEESSDVSKRFLVSELTPNGKRPMSLIR
jgi:hypothetical protein